ncbi:hypothetical protein GOBAR_DD00184 [Gossypium barbadense]|nr:hypothetical protein GOBAR_DD00184 [Gossypium barbadense]
MRPMPMEFVTDLDDQGSAMEVDDVDTPEIFGLNLNCTMDAYLYANPVNRHSYGGGAVALKHVEVRIRTPNKGEMLLKLDCRLTGQAMASALNVVQTSHSYGDLMLLMKAAELQQVCAALGGFFYYVFK